MYTAQDAINYTSSRGISLQEELDRQIRQAVERSDQDNSASIRVWASDWFADTIKEELEKRGFKNISGHDGVYKWDVYFEW